jgi:hypothetical protein
VGGKGTYTSIRDRKVCRNFSQLIKQTLGGTVIWSVYRIHCISNEDPLMPMPYIRRILNNSCMRNLTLGTLAFEEQAAGR